MLAVRRSEGARVTPIIRAATVADAQAIANLTVQLGYEADASGVAERLSHILSNPDQRFLVAEIDFRTAGWIHMLRVEYVDHPAFVMIGGLVVDRGHRRQGIGALLLQRAEEWARQCGCSLVRLSSSATRTEAHRFYESVGYTNVKTQYSFAKSVDGSDDAALRALVPRV